MRHKLSHEHNMSNIRTLQCKVQQRGAYNYVNAVIKNNKLCMNCGIIAVVTGITLSIMGNFLSSAQKHNR